MTRNRQAGAEGHTTACPELKPRRGPSLLVLAGLWVGLVVAAMLIATAVGILLWISVGTL